MGWVVLIFVIAVSVVDQLAHLTSPASSSRYVLSTRVRAGRRGGGVPLSRSPRIRLLPTRFGHKFERRARWMSCAGFAEPMARAARSDVVRRCRGTHGLFHSCLLVFKLLVATSGYVCLLGRRTVHEVLFRAKHDSWCISRGTVFVDAPSVQEFGA